MLTITPALEQAALLPYLRKSRMVYSPAFYAYQAKSGDEILAAALFEMRGDHVAVILYETTEAEDSTLFDGVLRAGLNYAAEQGVDAGKIPEAFRYEHRLFFGKLNYPPETAFNITNFFRKYKSCAT